MSNNGNEDELPPTEAIPRVPRVPDPVEQGSESRSLNPDQPVDYGQGLHIRMTDDWPIDFPEGDHPVVDRTRHDYTIPIVSDPKVPLGYVMWRYTGSYVRPSIDWIGWDPAFDEHAQVDSGEGMSGDELRARYPQSGTLPPIVGGGVFGSPPTYTVPFEDEDAWREALQAGALSSRGIDPGSISTKVVPPRRHRALRAVLMALLAVIAIALVFAFVDNTDDVLRAFGIVLIIEGTLLFIRTVRKMGLTNG